METKVFTNRTAVASCLIYKKEVDEKNREQAIIEGWFKSIPKAGDIIEYNSFIVLKIEGVHQYYDFREFEVIEVLNSRDFKGRWDDERCINSYHTIRVKASNLQINRAKEDIERKKLAGIS